MWSKSNISKSLGSYNHGMWTQLHGGLIFHWHVSAGLAANDDWSDMAGEATNTNCQSISYLHAPKIFVVQKVTMLLVCANSSSSNNIHQPAAEALFGLLASGISNTDSRSNFTLLDMHAVHVGCRSGQTLQPWYATTILLLAASVVTLLSLPLCSPCCLTPTMMKGHAPWQQSKLWLQPQSMLNRLNRSWVVKWHSAVLIQQNEDSPNQWPDVSLAALIIIAARTACSPLIASILGLSCWADVGRSDMYTYK